MGRSKVTKRIFGTVGALSRQDAKIHGKRIFVPYFELYAINHYFHLKQVGKKIESLHLYLPPPPINISLFQNSPILILISSIIISLHCLLQCYKLSRQSIVYGGKHCIVQIDQGSKSILYQIVSNSQVSCAMERNYLIICRLLWVKFTR